MYGFQRYCNDLEESVYPSCQKSAADRFRSPWASKIRVDAWVQKKGCSKTMGPPQVRCERPDEFLRKHSKCAPVYFNPKRLRDPKSKIRLSDSTSPTYRPDSVERRSKIGFGFKPLKLPQIDRDFVEENALKVIRMPPKREIRCYVDECGIHRVDLSDGPFVLRPGFGQVPPYILQRKVELCQEDGALRDELRIAKLPKGMRLLSLGERDSLLHGLKTRWQQLMDEYLKLPGYEGDWVKEKKTTLEAQLTDLEYDIRLLYSNEQIMIPSADSNNNPYQQSQYL